ncbi:hypothetical protein [Catenuloplanes indicus]|uniref:Uncharacterized protein n=1 Tax=Catenuloplanes indicus TaxID=137267 RepID=A0AAE4AU21_9ACTN|nr:hypothetical protein [Catenuloplanes indicus]MDQ0363360.1 hypothetical protein [Catenuloplanes indicus]MDQ0371682.1 hypothetical protein [Catenuloplanes indicus]
MSAPVLAEPIECLCADLAAAGLPVTCCVEGGRVWLTPNGPVDTVIEVRALAVALRRVPDPVWREASR